MNQVSIEQIAIGVLILFSVATWIVALIKIGQCWQARRFDVQGMDDLAQADTLKAVADHTQSHSGAVVRLIQRGQYVVTSTRDNTQTADRLEQALSQQVRMERRQLEKGLPLLASIASTSPFIGLFGTVWGIMEALKGISAAGNASLDTVAGPVGSALIATGIGIAVAVPAVLFYNGILRAVRNAQARWEDAAYAIFDHAQQASFRSQ